jgi:hypothetical protein
MSYNCIPRGGCGSEIAVRKLRIYMYVNGTLWLENGYLSSQENVNLLQSGVSKLVYSYSLLHALWCNGSGEMLMWLPGKLKIDSRESRGDSSLSKQGTDKFRIGVV